MIPTETAKQKAESIINEYVDGMRITKPGLAKAIALAIDQITAERDRLKEENAREYLRGREHEQNARNTVEAAYIHRLSGEHKDLVGMLTVAARVIHSARILTNHRMKGSAARSAGDWSRVHNALDEYDRALPNCEAIMVSPYCFCGHPACTCEEALKEGT